MVAIVLLSSFAAFAQSDEFEAARSSNLTGVSLPPGAQRLLPGHVPAEVGQTLDKLIAQSGGKVRRSGTEVLLWTGGDLQRSGAGTIVSRLTNNLKAAGWRYEAASAENGMTIFSVLKDGAERRALVGFHGEADGTFVFAWTELQADDAGRTNLGPPAGPTSGNVADYQFTTPAGWTRSDLPGEIVLRKDGNKTISFLPLMDSSGDLERDADRILWQVLKGHNTWYGNGFQPDYGTFERGKTAQGLEYFRAFRYAKKASDPNESFPSSRFDAIILLVKLGNKVAVAVGVQPFQTFDGRDSVLGALDLILYDLTFKNVANNYNLKNEILGSWSTASSTVALAYTFNANGSFSSGAVHEFRTSRDRYTDNVTTTSIGSTETYNVTGNVLTQNYKSTGRVMKNKIRVYETKYDKDPWKQKLGFLSLDNPEGGTMVLSKSQ